MARRSDRLRCASCKCNMTTEGTEAQLTVVSCMCTVGPLRSQTSNACICVDARLISIAMMFISFRQSQNH